MGLFLLLLAACTRHGHVPIQDRWQPDEGGLPEELLDAKLLAVGEPTHASPTTKTAWAAVLREWAAGAGDERRVVFLEGSEGIPCRRHEEYLAGTLDQRLEGVMVSPILQAVRELRDAGIALDLMCADTVWPPHLSFAHDERLAGDIGDLPVVARKTLDSGVVMMAQLSASGPEASLTFEMTGSFRGIVYVACYSSGTGWQEQWQLPSDGPRRLTLAIGNTPDGAPGEYDCRLRAVPAWQPSVEEQRLHVEVTGSPDAVLSDWKWAYGPGDVVEQERLAFTVDLGRQYATAAEASSSLLRQLPHWPGGTTQYAEAARLARTLEGVVSDEWGVHRERAMADLILDYMNHYDVERGIWFAHNLHVEPDRLRLGAYEGAGAHLQSRLGDQYQVVYGALGPGVVSRQKLDSATMTVTEEPRRRAASKLERWLGGSLDDQQCPQLVKVDVTKGGTYRAGNGRERWRSTLPPGVQWIAWCPSAEPWPYGTVHLNGAVPARDAEMTFR